MTQNLTILFDLDGTIVNTAPDLMSAHNHVMRKFGFEEKKMEDIKSLAGKGAWVMMQRSFKEEIKSEETIYKYFEYVAGSDTFAFNKPDPRHLTDVVEIIGGDLNKTIMIGDSEVDEMSAHNAKLPFILVKDGYTEKSENEIKHDALISDFVGFEKVIEKYL